MLVWTHRDPVLTFSSLASMIAGFLAAFGADKDLHAIGRGVFDMWSAAMKRANQARLERPDIEGRIIALAHKDVAADPMGYIRRIYDRLALPFRDEHADRIRCFLAEKPAARRSGQHQHRPE